MLAPWLKLSNILREKIKAGIFVGPEIRKIMNFDISSKLLGNGKKKVCNSFKAVVHSFLENHRAENYE